MTRTLELLDRLVGFPTVSHTSNLDLIDWARAHLQDAGFDVSLIPSPCGTKAGLLARIGPDAPGGICLSAHTDVVPTEGQSWTRAPFQLSEDTTRVYGRGTTDMKGFVASALALAERIDATRLTAPLSLVLSYDEEIGCVGLQRMLPTLEPMLQRPRLIVVGEPTSMQVATGHKGKTVWQVRCHGQAGHSALAPKFVNAIELAARFVGAMSALQQDLSQEEQDPDYDIPYSTVHVGKIAGGRAVNIVPDETTLDMELRYLPQFSGAEFTDRIKTIAQQLVSQGGPGAEIFVETMNAYPGLNPVQDLQVEDLATRLAGVPGTMKVAFGTEAGLFAQIGCDTVVIGPGDMGSDGHRPDEGVSRDQLALCDAMMDRIASELQ